MEKLKNASKSGVDRKLSANGKTLNLYKIVDGIKGGD